MLTLCAATREKPHRGPAVPGPFAAGDPRGRGTPPRQTRRLASFERTPPRQTRRLASLASFEIFCWTDPRANLSRGGPAAGNFWRRGAKFEEKPLSSPEFCLKPRKNYNLGLFFSGNYWPAGQTGLRLSFSRTAAVQNFLPVLAKLARGCPVPACRLGHAAPRRRLSRLPLA